VDHTIGLKQAPFTGLTYGITYTGAGVPNVEPSTQADFDEKAAAMSLLSPKFDSSLKYLMVAEQRLKEIFGTDPNKDGWGRFRETYPSASAIIAISRVGFNAARNQALVYVIRKGGGLNGSGIYFVMSKRGGAWSIEKAVMLWIS
jgi:hypothetical protein